MEGITLTINVNNDGKVVVHGPLQDKLLCYGLLEVARDIIREHKNLLEIPNGTLAPLKNLFPLKI